MSKTLKQIPAPAQKQSGAEGQTVPEQRLPIIPSRFRIDQPFETVYNTLERYFRAFVLRSQKEVLDMPYVEPQLSEAASFLCGRSKKAGLIISGGERSGKTTLINAIVGCINQFDPVKREKRESLYGDNIELLEDEDYTFSMRNFTPPFLSEESMLKAYDSPVLIIDDFSEIYGTDQEEDKGYALLGQLIMERNNKHRLTILSGVHDPNYFSTVLPLFMCDILRRSYDHIDIDGIRAEGNLPKYNE